MISGRMPARLAVASVVGLVSGLAVGCAPAPTPHYQFAASAFGTRAAVAGAVTSSPTFLTQLGCTTTAPRTTTNDGAGADLSALGTVGAIRGHTASSHGTTLSSTGVEEVANVDLLGGAVTASAIQVSSTTTHDSSGFHTLGKMTFLGLKIANRPVTGTIPPNTRLTIPGIGTVTLNEQTRSVGINNSGQSTTALHIRTNTSNVSGGLPVGADVVVAQASSALGGPVAGRFGGVAYGTNLNVGTLIGSGMSAPAYVSCGGSGGRLLTNSTAGITVPNVATLGAVTDTARSTMTATTGTVETTSNIGAVDLLSGLVTANVIKADARATLSGKFHNAGDAGTHFAGLSVQGFPNINDNVAPNTKLTIPNVGTLYLHRVIKTPGSIEIRMVELVLSQAQGGLPINADIKIGVASAGSV